MTHNHPLTSPLQQDEGVQILWFKRDLRVQDNKALWECARMAFDKGQQILPLYILEPALWQQPDMSHRHYEFLRECLIDLYQQLKKLGQPLIIKIGEPTQVLADLHERIGISDLWSHQETWNNFTYQRDRAVKRFCRANHIPWHEPLQHGVFRRLSTRNIWVKSWQDVMHSDQYPVPNLADINKQPLSEPTHKFPKSFEIGLPDDGCTHRQNGGRGIAEDLLKSFIYERGEKYSREMSSPVSAFISCSRLSPHIAFGTISMKEVLQACYKADDIERMYGTKNNWSRAMRSFASRLHWHCHFMQKLEDEPSIEYENLHLGYNGMREHDFNEAYFEAWKTGNTGYPMIDACMRALIATGWINFRMRAMLISFATYHLWLHWHRPALHLAQMFTDYEPGIHYSQVQMQAGTTGINSIRVYNPLKQSMEQDPDGVFIRQWIPELADVPLAFLHTPWTCPHLLNGYPLPIVDEKQARKSATQKVHERRKSLDSLITKNIVKKHASRSGARMRKKSKKKEKPKADNGQLGLF